MSYTFKNTEINNEKASTFETKSMLYLLSKRKDSKEIEYVTFDCFNDVSGLYKRLDSIWDIQSKNEKTLSPKKIGTYLFTLFDNYVSSFKFREFILFSTPINSDYKIDDSLKSYRLNNIKTDTFARIKNGLSEEINRVKGKTKDYSIEIDDFLKVAIIVEDFETENEYVKSLIRFKDTAIKSDDFYKSIFIDLRNIQSNKKQSYIENVTISEIREVLHFQRHLSTKDIELLILSRVIGCEIFSFTSIPLYFLPVIESYNFQDKTDILQECNANLSRAFFNKNSNKAFWQICEKIISHLNTSISKDVENLYSNIFSSYTPKLSFLSEITIKYLISIIIEKI